MKLRNLALVFCASGALLAACGSSDDSAPNNAAGASGKGGGTAAGASGKGGGAGTAGKGGGGNVAGEGNEAGIAGTSESAGEGGMGGEGGVSSTKAFTVTLENIAPVKAVNSSGVFDKPFGSSEVKAATPGQYFTFTVDAGRKQKLYFATMLGATNDLFFAPNGDGISLYDDADGKALGATDPLDVTSQVYLWDAGTEVNQEPFIGPDTITKETTKPQGAADTNNKVRKVAADNTGFPFAYPAVNTMVQVTVHSLGGTMFEVRIYDLGTAKLAIGGEATPTHDVPLSPGVWAVSGAANAIFTEGQPDLGKGLESIAEDGSPMALGAYLAGTSGITYPASPGVWLVHSTGTKPLFTAGTADYGKGIEAIAEDGKEATLGANVASLDGYITGAVFNTPVNATMPGPITPGLKYSFTFDANPGDSLSFASMLAATNDVFFAPVATGIPLFDDNGVAVTGDVSDKVSLWDAGTEANEEPGIGPFTVTNERVLNTGAVGEGKVQLLSAVANPNSYVYPASTAVLKVTISAK